MSWHAERNRLAAEEREALVLAHLDDRLFLRDVQQVELAREQDHEGLVPLLGQAGEGEDEGPTPDGAAVHLRVFVAALPAADVVEILRESLPLLAGDAEILRKLHTELAHRATEHFEVRAVWLDPLPHPEVATRPNWTIGMPVVDVRDEETGELYQLPQHRKQLPSFNRRHIGRFHVTNSFAHG